MKISAVVPRLAWKLISKHPAGFENKVTPIETPSPEKHLLLKKEIILVCPPLYTITDI